MGVSTDASTTCCNDAPPAYDAGETKPFEQVPVPDDIQFSINHIGSAMLARKRKRNPPPMDEFVLLSKGSSVLQPSAFGFAVYKFSFVDPNGPGRLDCNGYDERYFPVYFVRPDGAVFDGSQTESDIPKLPLDLIDKRYEMGIGGAALCYIGDSAGLGRAGQCFVKLLAVEPVGSDSILCRLSIDFDKSGTTRRFRPGNDGNGETNIMEARACTFGTLVVCNIKLYKFSKTLDDICEMVKYDKDTVWAIEANSRIRQLARAARRSKKSSSKYRELRHAIAQSWFCRPASDVLMQEKYLGSRIYYEIKDIVLDLAATSSISSVYLGFALRNGMNFLEKKDKINQL